MNDDEYFDRSTYGAIDNKIDRQRKLVKCRKCESFWRSDLIDTCNCGFTDICPNCMRDHFCRGGVA